MNLRLNESTNPIISSVRKERKEQSQSYSYVTGETATFSGIATKTGFLIAVIFGVSIFIWLSFDRLATILLPSLYISAFVGLISVALAQWTRYKALFTTVYAVSEGVVLGTLTFAVRMVLPEGGAIVVTAIALTFAIFGFLLVAYSTGLFKVGFGFRKVVYSVMFGLVIGYLILMILSLFGINVFAALPFGAHVALSVFFIILASFNLLIDFDDCKRGVEYGLPKQYEWVLTLGLLVSIVWLFVEVLRLLLILASRARER